MENSRRILNAGLMATLATTIVLLASSGGCERSNASPPPPPPAVTVSVPMQQMVVEWDEYTGHLQAPEYVEVRARVSGLMLDAPFKEGALVKRGTPLFQIDRSPFQADLDSKKADVAKAAAQLGLAQVQLDRAAQQLQTNAISKSDYDNAAANVKQADAVLAGAKAAQETSELNLGWCTVIAPIDGRVGQKLIQPGNLISGGSGQTTLLTTITSVDPMYCYIPVDERSILKYQKLAREKQRVSARDQPIPAYLQLENETTFPHSGLIDFVDNKLDPGTGTLLSRGVFPNGDKDLLQGLFARIRVAGSGFYKALLVPDASVGTDQNIKYLLIVNGDNKVERRPVELGAAFGQMRGISKGVGPDDKVVVEGMLRAIPGTTVQPDLKPIDQSLFKRPIQAGADTKPAATEAAMESMIQATTVPISTPAATNPIPKEGGSGKP